jgi:hypothetical protein
LNIFEKVPLKADFFSILLVSRKGETMQSILHLRIRQALPWGFLILSLFLVQAKPSWAQLQIAAGDSPRFLPSPATGSSVTIAYVMRQPGTAQFRVYNAWGFLVAFISDQRSTGLQTSTLDISSLSTGNYFYLAVLDYGAGGQDRFRTLVFAVKK